MAEQSKRMVDWNGFMEVRDNPISKVGVYPYLGSEIPGAEDPNRIYQVYRPAEELSRPDTIDSFKLMPFIDEHEILGKSGMPAERKGMQGTLGEQIYFDAPYLRGNIKIHSSAAQSLIKAGKVELSPCYGCDWVKGDGTFDGKPYQYTQRNIMGNHLALVEEGRTGPDVAVQDHRTFTLDSKELLPMEFTPEQLAQLKALIAEMMGAKTGDEDPVKPDPAADADPDPDAVMPDVSKDDDLDPDAIADPEVTPEQGDAAEQAVSAAEQAQEAIQEVAAAIEEVASASEEVVAAADSKRKPAMDKLTKAKAKLAAARSKATKLAADAKLKSKLAKDGALVRQVHILQAEVKALKAKPAQDGGLALITQVADRDALANRVTPFTGAFDHSRMTAAAVAKYAVDKLSITCAKGNEAIALDAWLQGRKPAHETIARDSAPKTGDASAHSLWKGAK